jgi:hypothetical protein
MMRLNPLETVETLGFLFVDFFLLRFRGLRYALVRVLASLTSHLSPLLRALCAGVQEGSRGGGLTILSNLSL